MVVNNGNYVKGAYLPNFILTNVIYLPIIYIGVYMKEKKYELIWSLIVLLIGVFLSIIGYIVFPIIALILPIGIFLILYGLFNFMKNKTYHNPWQTF